MMEEGILIRDKCPVCSGTSSKSIFKRSFDEVLIKDYMNVAYQGNAKIGFLKGVNFQIVKCNYCHLLYQKIVLSEERLDELYNNWIDPKLAQEWNDNKLLKEDNLYSYIFEFVNCLYALLKFYQKKLLTRKLTFSYYSY